MQTKEYELLRECGLIDEIAARNMEIREKFRCRAILGLRRGEKGNIKDQLAKEYSMDIKAIEKIIYSKKQNKKKIFFSFKEYIPQK